jgi:indole-3-glycerol phosphate synthase
LNCSYRLTEGGNYCFQHTNKCANCSTRIADSQNYCSSCEVQQQKETEQTKLKSLVKANTTITGDIQEVERFSPSQGI